ncbi:4'-phosphopantetheinyl transferase superfamily protein [Mycoplasma aquilae ATCC BAA-1896]|uniref:4'-phosphopantetheinyl transferase superfamily protein n=1 Tax=Mycoplasma aquilae TaxID=1312741 RepID=UPI003A848CD7
MNGIGIDITNISRFLNKGEIFWNRVLSADELVHFNKLDTPDSKAKFLARSWAIKEAIFKADNTYIDFRKVNIKKDSESKLWKFKDFLISISYADDFVIAVVAKQ